MYKCIKLVTGKQVITVHNLSITICIRGRYTWLPIRAELHKIPARVQCTVQVCRRGWRTCTPHHTVAGRSSISLTQSPFAFPSATAAAHPLSATCRAVTLHHLHACRLSCTHLRTLCDVHGLCSSVLEWKKQFHRTKKSYEFWTKPNARNKTDQWIWNDLYFWCRIGGSACYLLQAGFLLGLFFTLKIEATCSSETLVEFQRTTRRYIPGYRTLHDLYFRSWFYTVIERLRCCSGIVRFQERTFRQQPLSRFHVILLHS
jgi:hypothetical protein